MALRFLADHCISNLTIQTLRNMHHEVVRLRDALPPDSPDAVVIAKAQDLDAILLSLNSDFADIVIYPPATYKASRFKCATILRSFQRSCAVLRRTWNCTPSCSITKANCSW